MSALDVIAERICALGYPMPGIYKEFVKPASTAEVAGVPKVTDMVRHLVSAQEATARKLFPLLHAAADRPTAGLNCPARRTSKCMLRPAANLPCNERAWSSA